MQHSNDERRLDAQFSVCPSLALAWKWQKRTWDKLWIYLSIFFKCAQTQFVCPVAVTVAVPVGVTIAARWSQLWMAWWGSRLILNARWWLITCSSSGCQGSSSSYTKADHQLKRTKLTKLDSSSFPMCNDIICAEEQKEQAAPLSRLLWGATDCAISCTHSVRQRLKLFKRVWRAVAGSTPD